MPTPFQKVIQVRDLAEARIFYQRILGGLQGHTNTGSIEFKLYDHQLVCHLDPPCTSVPHQPISLELEQWNLIAQRLKQGRAELAIAPYVTHFNVASGELAAIVLFDPSGNALEFKLLHDIPKQRLGRERSKRLCAIAWAMLAAAVMFWILLRAKDRFVGENFAIPALGPACALTETCTRKVY